MTKEEYSLFWWSRRTGKQTRPRSRDYLLLRDWDGDYCIAWWPKNDGRSEIAAKRWGEPLWGREVDTYASALEREGPIVDAALEHHPIVIEGALSANSAPLTAAEVRRYKDRLRDRVRPVLSGLMARRLEEDREFQLGFPSQFAVDLLKERACCAADEVMPAAVSALARNSLERFRSFVGERSDEQILEGLSRAREEWITQGEMIPDHAIDVGSARRLLLELSNGQQASEALANFLNDQGGNELAWRRALELLALSKSAPQAKPRWGLPIEWESAVNSALEKRRNEMVRRSFRGRCEGEDLAQQSTQELIERLRRHAVREYLCGRAPDEERLKRWTRVSASHVSRGVAREHDHGPDVEPSLPSGEEDSGELPDVIPEIQRVAAGRRQLFSQEVEADAITSWRDLVAIGKQPESLQEIEEAIEDLLSSDHCEGADADHVARVRLLVNEAVTLWGTQRMLSAEHQAAEEF